MKSCFLLISTCLLSAGVLQAYDNTAPVVTSISIAPSAVEVSSGPANVTVALQITDDLTGFRSGSLYLYRPDGRYLKSIPIKSSERTSGTSLSGIYEIPVEIPGYGSPGIWRFDASVSDGNYNWIDYGRGAAETEFPVPSDAIFTVTNTGTPDTSGPIATHINFSPLTGNVAVESITITATFDLTDVPSGFDYGNIFLVNPSGNSDFNSYGQFDASKRVSGDEHNGSYVATAIIPRGALPGNWKVYLSLGDKLGNYTSTPQVSLAITNNPGIGGLADVCDATQYEWTTRGDASWTAQTDTTYDGIDAARSGLIGDGEQSVMEVEVSGPGTLTFWWKTDCASGDSLSVVTTGSGDSDTLSGQAGWSKVSLEIESGTQTVTWTYAKNLSDSAGEDCGYVDRVQFTAEEDTAAPVVQYLKISPNPATIYSGDVDVTLTFEVSDEYSGVIGGEVSIEDPNGNNFYIDFDSNDLLDGDDSFGTYEVTFTLNQYDFQGDPTYFELGLWQARITVEDDYGNSRYYGQYDDAFPIPGTGEFNVTDEPLAGNLGIVSIDSFVPNPVDITSGAQSVTINLTMNDPDDLFSNGRVYLYRPDNSYIESYFFNKSSLPGGQYSVLLNVPRYGQPGDWRVSFWLYDKDNKQNYISGSIQNPSDDRFTVVNTGPVDNDPAVVSSIAIAPKVVDTSSGSVDIAVTVGISDALSELTTIWVNFIDPSGYEIDYEYVNGALITGGSFTVHHTMPEGSEEGHWHCTISTRDKVGNYREYGPESYNTPFPVPADAEFTVGPVTESSFSNFATEYSLTGNDALLGANPDNDWASNAMEFLLGLNPTVATVPNPALYQASRVANELRLDFKPAVGLTVTDNGNFLNVANTAGGAPVRVTGQIATDLAGPWTNILPVPAGGGVYRVTLPIGPGTRGFCRLKFLDP